MCFQTDAPRRGRAQEPHHETMDAAQADVRLVEPSQPVRQRVHKRNIPHAPDLRVRLVRVRRRFVRRDRLRHLFG